MRTQLIGLAILLFQFTSLFSQEKGDFQISEDQIFSNNIFLDLVGGGAILSFGYERHFRKSEKGFPNLRVGVGINEELTICIYGNCDSSGKKYAIFYQQLTYNFGRDKKFFEVGAGGSLALHGGEVFYYPHAYIGYRVMPKKTPRLMGKIYSNIPLYGLQKMDFFFMPFGISLGYRL